MNYDEPNQSPSPHALSPQPEPAAPQANFRYVLLFLIISLVYLCTLSEKYFGGIPDGWVMFQTAVSLHELGELEIGPASDPISGAATLSEKYGMYGLGYSVVLQLPLLIAAPVEKAFGQGRSNVLFPLTNMMLTAMTALLVALCLRDLGFLFRTGALAAIGFAFGTFAWPYISYDFSEPLQALCVVASFWLLIRAVRVARHSRAFLTLAGIVLGFAVLTKVALLILIPSYAFYLWASLNAPLRVRIPHLAWFGFPLVIWSGAIAVLNWHRFGSAFEFGYGIGATAFNTPILTGLYGLLLSPNKGLVFYAPLALLVPWSLWKMRKDYLIELLFLVSVFALQVILITKWWSWEGAQSWGPRLLSPILPLVVLGAGMLLELARRAIAPFVVCMVAGVAINLLGILIFFNAWSYVLGLNSTRIPLDVRGRSPAEYVEQDGKRWFRPIIGMLYLPALSPIRGHAWLLRMRYFDNPFSIKPLCNGGSIPASTVSFSPIEINFALLNRSSAVSWLCSAHFWLWETLSRQPRDPVRTRPLYGAAIELQGDRASLKGDLQRSLQFYRRAADLMPNDLRPTLKLSRLLSQLGELSEAQRTLAAFVVKYPAETSARLELARLYELTGDRASALREYLVILRFPIGNDIRHQVLQKIVSLSGPTK